MAISSAQLQDMQSAFGGRMQTHVSLKRYTAARLGGEADVLVMASSAEQLGETVSYLWKMGIPFIILGSGSNVLVAEAGVRQVVVLNRAQKTTFNPGTPSVWAESGANLGVIARRAAGDGFSGLEWAAGIPGTVGGAVYGNAGAHGGDMQGSLMLANILHRVSPKEPDRDEIVQEQWPVEKFEYAYRSSSLKRQPGRAVVLAAELSLTRSTPQAVTVKMDEFRLLRRSSQPPGASLGSVFKNPPGESAGRLIEQAGLKGTTLGSVEISRKHANFFINQEGASASDYAALIRMAQEKVYEKFQVKLELEIELIGDWIGQG